MHPTSAIATTPRIFAVVVTYHPEPTVLQRLLERLLPQVAGVVVADNGSAGVLPALLAPFTAAGQPLHYLDLGGNAGLASALNQGVAHAWQQGATHVLLSDQDSLPMPDMVAELHAAWQALSAQGMQVAAVGPCFSDGRSTTASAPFQRLKGGSIERLRRPADGLPVEVDYLITSGSLIAAPAWQAIGDMLAPLFIDCVDTEWGWRARQRGYRSFGVWSAGMEHAIGEQPYRCFGRRIPMHSPLRHYYMARNAVWLYRQPGLPPAWKRAHGRRLLLQFLFYSLFTPPRLAHCREMLCGAWHGLRGRLGPRQASRATTQSGLNQAS